MGLGFDMSNFNEDASDDVYTIGISMPIRMVQYPQLSLLWKKNNSYIINWEIFIHGAHGYFSSSENIVINPFCQ